MTNSMMNKSYTEMLRYNTFKDRFEYLKLDGIVGDLTFNGHRRLNQMLYRCDDWKYIRREVIIRDCGRDLGIEGREIDGKILVHHINPITVEDILNRSYKVFDMDNLITVSHKTHNALHYGDERLMFELEPVERRKDDTCLWR